MGGKIVDNLFASIDLPEPGGPMRIKIGYNYTGSIKYIKKLIINSIIYFDLYKTTKNLYPQRKPHIII
jgi:hypothetical protein